jgi:hypothetical protein
MTMTPDDEMVLEIQARHPGWEVWIVYRTHGPALWCAKPRTEATARFDATGPAELESYIVTAEEEGT